MQNLEGNQRGGEKYLSKREGKKLLKIKQKKIKKRGGQNPDQSILEWFRGLFYNLFSHFHSPLKGEKKKAKKRGKIGLKNKSPIQILKIERKSARTPPQEIIKIQKKEASFVWGSEISKKIRKKKEGFSF